VTPALSANHAWTWTKAANVSAEELDAAIQIPARRTRVCEERKQIFRKSGNCRSRRADWNVTERINF